MKPLFAYGTLRDDAWRAAILGAHYPARPATLRGYRRVANTSGYLSLRATGGPADAAAGVLIELDELGWRIADAWEDAAVTHRADAATTDRADAAVTDGASAATTDPSAATGDGLVPAARVIPEIVLYARTDVGVDTADGPVEATAYVCPDDAGAPVPDDRLALCGDGEVEAAIASFLARMRGLRRSSGRRESDRV